MKKLLFALLLFGSIASAQQVGTPMRGYVVPTIAAMKAYVGSENIVHVDFTNADYSTCFSCTANEVNIFAGQGGKKWKKNESKVNPDSLVLDATHRFTTDAEKTAALARLDSIKVKERIRDSLNLLRVLLSQKITLNDLPAIYFDSAYFTGNGNTLATAIKPKNTIGSGGISFDTTSNFYYDSVNNRMVLRQGGFKRIFKLDSSISILTGGGGSGGGGSGGGTGFLTWTTIGSDMEQYNSSKGMRKKSSGQTGWSTPSRAASSSLAAQTFSFGDKIVMKIGADPAAATTLIMSSTTTPDESTVPITNVNYAVFAGTSLNPNVSAQQNNAGISGSVTAIAAGDLIRVTYGANMLFEKSSNGGTSWTTFANSTDTPTGTYNLIVQSYSISSGFDEIYKQ